MLVSESPSHIADVPTPDLCKLHGPLSMNYVTWLQYSLRSHLFIWFLSALAEGVIYFCLWIKSYKIFSLVFLFFSFVLLHCFIKHHDLSSSTQIVAVYFVIRMIKKKNTECFISEIMESKVILLMYRNVFIALYYLSCNYESIASVHLGAL